MTKLQWTLFIICVLLHINKVRCQCGSTQSLSASYASAVIQSPGYNTGYSQNLACTWSISTSLSGASIIFQIRDIWISCSGDKVVTYDGTSDTAAVIDDLCSSSGGGAKGNIRVPSSGDVFLKFTTNNNVDAATEKGFQFFYTAAKDFSGSGCPGPQSLTPASTDSYISSPGFPSKYSLSQTCSWVITAADSSEHVYIEFIFIDIENDGTCQYDYLRIQDGTIDTKICVTEWNYGTTYTSTGTSFTLTFYSDDAQDAQGFLLKYRQTQTDTTTKTPETTTVAEDVTASSESDTKVTSTVTVTTAETLTQTQGITTEDVTTTSDIDKSVTTTVIVTTAETTSQAAEITTEDVITTSDFDKSVTTTVIGTTAETTSQVQEITTENATKTSDIEKSVTSNVTVTTDIITTHVTDTAEKVSTEATSGQINKTTTEIIKINKQAVRTNTDELPKTILPASAIESSTSINDPGSSQTTTTARTETSTEAAQLGASSSESCESTTCVLPAVLGSVIGTGAISVAGLFAVMKAKGIIGKYSPGQNKVNVEKGDRKNYGEKKDKNEMDQNKNVDSHDPDQPPPYITEKSAVDIVIIQPLENG